MAVAFDAVGPGASGSAVSSLTWTHTPAGTPTAVGVWTGGYGATVITGITYGGTSMTAGTLYTPSGSSGPQTVSYGLAGPASGAQTVVVSASDICYIAS